MEQIRKKQIIALGLEAAEIDLLRKWTKEGYLPTLSKIMENGCWRKLMSTAEISSQATWPSITTGVSPAKHGMGFYHRQLKSGSYRIVKKYAEEIGYPFFWKKLSDAHLKTAIFDIPVVYLIKHFNGVQLIGWGAEGLNFKQSSDPPELLKEILSKFGHHPIEGWYQKMNADVNEWKNLRQKILNGVRLRTSIIEWILDKENWDLFFAGFAEMHLAGHYFWHLTDEKNPNYDEGIAKICGDTILKIYMEVDNSINGIMKKYPDATYFIFSNSGMGPNYSGQHLIPQILKRMGLAGNAETQNNKSIYDKISPAKKWGPYALKKIETITSSVLIEKAKNMVPAKLWDRWTRRILAVGNNWNHCKAFHVPSDFTGSIRINLIGREPEGKINPGKEYDDLCSEIENLFMELINPATSKKAVKKVIKVRDRYTGKYINELPDIIIKWEGENPISSLYSSRIGTVTGELPDKRTGAHQTYGFFIAYGKETKPLGKLDEKNIMDIAPTILNYFDIPIPADIDGIIMNDMRELEFSAKA